MTALPEVLSAPAPEFAPIYARSGQQPGMAPGKADSGGGGDEGGGEGYESPASAAAAIAHAYAKMKGEGGGGSGEGYPTPDFGEIAHAYAKMQEEGEEPASWDMPEVSWKTGPAPWTMPKGYKINKTTPPLPAGTPHPKPIYDDFTGEVIGWSDGDGNVYDADGNLMSTAPKSEDPWDDKAGMYESEKPKTTQDFIDEYLSDDSDAITPEEVFGELYGMDQAEAKAGADLASMMGGLGMGRSGQHMGAQTALSAQTFADKHKRLTDIELANENLRAEKAKNVIEMHWKEADAEERKRMHDELIGLQKDADKYSAAEWLLGLTQKGKFSQEGLQVYFEMWDAGHSVDEIMAVLIDKGYLKEEDAGSGGFWGWLGDSIKSMVGAD
tara:strand:- start:5453 stop:6601 length:1149 start_codon:yes stop_codon:yes gene_type:complete